MSRERCVHDLARDQLEQLQAPTVIVPVQCDGQTATFLASYTGDSEWLALASRPDLQVELAIACCKRAHAAASSRSQGRVRPLGASR